MASGRLALVVALTAVMLLGVAALVAIADDGDADRDRVVTATGRAERRVAPEVAVLRLGVTVRRPEPQPATRAASEALRRVIDAARRVGVADLQTDPVRLSRERPPRPGGRRAPEVFVARQAITVRMRDLDRVGALLDAAVEAGATDVTGPRYELAEPQQARRRVLAAAVEDARAAAREMAEAAGVRVGAVLWVEERANGGSGPSALREEAAAETAPPTVPGPVRVRAQVSVTFAVR